MSLERGQRNNESLVEALHILLSPERGQLSGQELNMYDAQNTACFYFFLKAMGIAHWSELISTGGAHKEEAFRAYTLFRDELEQNMKEQAPKTYEAYLIAITQCDADEARRIISEYVEEEE